MNPDILNRVFDEDLQAHERRFSLLKQKLTLSLAILGLGSLKVEDIASLHYLLLLVPLVPILIDFAILGESYNLRRNQVFLLNHCGPGDNHIVEHIRFIMRNVNPYHRLTHMGITLLIVAAALTLHLALSDRKDLSWLFVLFLGPLGLHWWVSGQMRRKIEAALEKRELLENTPITPL